MITSGQAVTYDGGGYGHFTIGPSLLQSNDLSVYIQMPAVLGLDADANQRSLMIGGEGFGIIGRFIVGGGGMAMEGVTWRSIKGSATVFSSSGYFKTGYVVYQRPRQFIVAGLGVGGSSTGIDLLNTSGDDCIAFDPIAPIQSGDSGSYTLNSFFAEPFVSWKLFSIAANNASGAGGMLVGLDVGCSILLPGNQWMDQDMKEVRSIDTPAWMSYPFVRLTIGGGGIGYHVPSAK